MDRAARLARAVRLLMAKALKTAAIVVGVAALAVVTGGAAAGLGLSLATTFVVGGAYVSAGALALGAAALSVGSALLTKKPSVTSAQTDRLFANVTPRAFRKTPLGSTALPVDVRYEEWSGKDQEYCDWIVEHASCAIDGVEEIWFDTELAWTASAGAIGKYRGYFSIPNLILEGTTANAFTFGAGKWNAASARLVGCAYARWRFKVTGNSKKAESPFASGLPSRITVIGRGAKLYDPRRDSTVPGGSGPMRADDQTTWRFTADDGVVIGDNLPLQILRVVLGWRIRNPVTGVMLLATGSGVPPRRLRLQSWITSANIADELVNRSAGGQEPRYHGAAVVSEGDDTKQTLDMLCAGCCGRFRDTQGRLALDIAHNDLAAIATDEGLLDDDVIGGFTWDPDPGFDGIPNVIRGQYVDATTGSLYQLLDYPEVRIASPDGVDRVRTVDLGAVESPSQAQRIVKQILQRALFNRKFTAPFDIRAWKYPVGAVLPFTFAALGFVRVAFRVEAQELGQDGVCNMTLSFEHQAIYAWDKDDSAPVIAADPIVYDASKNPLILAIADAGETAEWEYVGDRSGKKPEDNATNGAPTGSKVAGRPAETVVADLDVAMGNLLTEMLRNATFRGESDEIWYLPDGTPVRAVTQVLSALVDGHTAYIADLRQVDGNGNLKAAFVLNSKGHVTGITQLNDGTKGSFYVVADEFGFVDPAGGTQAEPIKPLYYVDGKLYMDNVYIRKLDVDVVTMKNIAADQVTGLVSHGFLDQSITPGGGEVTIADLPGIVIGDSKDGKGKVTIELDLDGTVANDAGIMLRAYVNLGSGYQLYRAKPQGIRVIDGNARWILPVSMSVSVFAGASVGVRFTAQSTGIGGGGLNASYVRNVEVSIQAGYR